VKRAREEEERTIVPKGPTFETMRTRIEEDYKVNGQDAKTLRYPLNRLAKQFKGWPLARFTREVILEYQRERRLAGAAAATVNMDCAILRRMLHLAGVRLEIPRLRTNNARPGFFEKEEFARVLEALPAHLKPLMEVAYITGWRVISELMTRQWKHVEEDLWLRLDPGEAKNDEPRRFPLIPNLKRIIHAQRVERRRLEKEKGISIPWIFFHDDGRPIKDYDNAWRSACKVAGCPERIVHDLRRTAVRNLVRARATEGVVMRLTGHKTRAVFERYNIVSGQDLRDAGTRLGVYLEGTLEVKA
jgi:site-specific recombinase XerD